MARSSRAVASKFAATAALVAMLAGAVTIGAAGHGVPGQTVVDAAGTVARPAGDAAPWTSPSAGSSTDGPNARFPLTHGASRRSPGDGAGNRPDGASVELPSRFLPWIHVSGVGQTRSTPVPTATPTTTPTTTATTTGTAAPTRTQQPPSPSATRSLVDECADMPPEWVFCDDFEQRVEWDGSVKQPTVVAVAGPLGNADNHAALLRVPPGAGGSGLWKRLPESDRLYARWFVLWEPGHDLSARHHGPGGLGADTAWYTGRSGIRPDGDEYFVASLEASTRDPHPMYSYTYYRGMYMDCADPNGRCWGDLFPCYAGPTYCTRPEHAPTVQQAGFETGRWYCLEQMIDAGSPVSDGSQADGQLDFWIDGVEIGPWTDLWWRTVPTLKVNFLWLYLYHHAEHSVEGIAVDNAVVSTAPIGCGR